jgi:hypothetical protein
VDTDTSDTSDTEIQPNLRIDVTVGLLIACAEILSILGLASALPFQRA